MRQKLFNEYSCSRWKFQYEIKSSTLNSIAAESIINELPKQSEILICDLKTERALPASKLRAICENNGYQSRKFDNVREAMQYAKGSKTLVTGSFYTVSSARVYLKLEGYSEL